MAKKRIRNFNAYPLNGGWKASFVFDSITFKPAKKSKDHKKKGRHKDKKKHRDEKRMVIDVLRRRRWPKETATNSRDWFRTIAGLVQLKKIEIELPTANKLLVLHLNKHAPKTPGVFDFPTDSEQEINALQDWPFLPTALKVKILGTAGARWPDFISHAVLKILKTGNETSITLNTLLKSHFGLTDPGEGDGLLLNPDGLTLIGVKPVPWESASTLRGKFRYRFRPDGTHWLEIEKNPEWIGSLRNYRYQIIKATAHQEDDDGLPEVDSPGVGLVSSEIPDKVFWQLVKNQWLFIPDPGMFEGEIRGAAGATSRLRFDEVSILDGGKKISCKSGIQVSSDANVNYEFNSGESSLWTGAFDAELEEEGRELMGTLMQQYGLEADEDRAWIQTESGALQLPLQKGSDSSKGQTSFAADGLFKGLLRFSEVPWIKDAKELPPGPDISQIGYSSLIIMNARGFEANFSFNSGDEFTCTGIDVQISEPELRLEDYLPVYLPPLNGQDIFGDGPPDLPTPTAFGEDNPWNHFLGLSLIRRKDYQPDSADTNFKVNISFQPGIADKNALIEGDWTNSHTQVQIPVDRIKDVRYWYRPPGLHWIPGLPLYGDPRAGDRVNDKRTFMALKASEAPSIFLKPGINWQVPVLMSGSFEVPEETSELSQYSLFNWVIPELPGIALELNANSPITLADGMPAAGKLNWIWRHDLPILDEINALRASNEDEKEEEGKTELPRVKWTDQLKEIYLLSQIRGSLLMKSSVNLKKSAILSENAKKVQLKNLFAGQEFAGSANLQIIPPTASLNFSAGTDAVNAITEQHLLKGIDASFEVAYDATQKKFELLPVSTNGPVRMVAGTLLPHKYKLDKEFVTFDQQGMGSFQIKDDRKGRAVLVSSAGDQALKKAWLWSRKLLDLSTSICHVQLNFSNIPLIIDNGKWAYLDDLDLVKSVQFRDFGWGSIGELHFWGLSYQVCNIIAMYFNEGENTTPNIPTKIVFDGILHFKSKTIHLADIDTQRVQVTFVRKGNSWELEEFEGSVLWPFYELALDLSETEKMPDPLPWLSAAVNSEKVGDKMTLVFGKTTQPATVWFSFMERTWKLPVNFADSRLSTVVPDDHTFNFELIPDESAVHATLMPTSGTFCLKRKGNSKNSQLAFNMVVTHESGTERSLLDMDFDYAFNKGKNQLSLAKADILSFGDSNHLISLSGSEKGAVELSPGKLTLAINKATGWRKNKSKFELLPGWSISDEESLQAYLSLQVVSPPATGEVNRAPLKTLQMVIETAIAAPDTLSTLISYSLNSGMPPQLAIKLTGILRLSNEISWSAGDQRAYAHEMDIYLRHANLAGSKLASKGDAFFRPKYEGASGQNEAVTGMIELPCLANHRLMMQNGSSSSMILQWTASQSIRLAPPKSYIEEILLRGVSVQLPALEYSTRHRDRNARYRFGDMAVNFKPSEAVEMGFVGALGTELERLLKKNPDIMVIDASEAFWIRSFADDISKRSPFDLWRKKSMEVSGLPTFDQDFDDSGKTDVVSWARLAIPFVTDSRRYIGNNKSAALEALLSNQPPVVDGHTENWDAKTLFLSRESLLKLSEIDQFSLDNQPNEVEMSSGMDPVIFDPVAYERLFPYTMVQRNFEPGWLSFYDWKLDDKDDVSRGIPFGSTLSSIHALNKHQQVVQMAVTEAVPKVEGLPGSDSFKINPYYITSPAVALDEALIPFRPSTHSLRQLAGTPRIFLEWEGITADELNYIPPGVVEELLGWANSFTVDQLRSHVPDAPGGFSKTEEGYGIGKLVAGRIQKRIQQKGPFTHLQQLLEIQGFGLDKLSDFIYAVAKDQYDFSFEQLKFEEIRISVQFWLPGSSSDLAEPRLASQNVFLLGITDVDSWETVLFPPTNTAGFSKVRKRIWEWVAGEKTRLNVDVSPLLRVRLLTPSKMLVERKYFLVESRLSGGAVQKSKRKELNTNQPLSVDPRFERLPEASYTDSLAAGPELLRGEVYYEPRTWFEPTEPVLDNKSWRGIHIICKGGTRLDSTRGNPQSLAGNLKLTEF